MKLDKLLAKAADNPPLPPHFMEKVEARVAKQSVALQRRQLLMHAGLLGSALVLFFWTLSLFLTSAIAFETVDFLSLAWTEPGILAAEEGRLALLEAIPFASLLMTCVAVALIVWGLRRLTYDLTHVCTSLFCSPHVQA